MAQADNITRLLHMAAAGDRQANDELFSSVYRELRVIARSHRQRWQGNATVNTTALINEAYLKLAGRGLADYKNRTHFFATASKAMRQVLASYAERASASKRGGNALRVTLTGNLPPIDDMLDDLLQINELLLRLEETNPRGCRLVECRVFGGMTFDETAAALGVSAATIKRDWALISAWLYREIEAGK